jgi:hypothetical protein
MQRIINNICLYAQQQIWAEYPTPGIIIKVAVNASNT